MMRRKTESCIFIDESGENYLTESDYNSRYWLIITKYSLLKSGLSGIVSDNFCFGVALQDE